jgi:hypothetical protein
MAAPTHTGPVGPIDLTVCNQISELLAQHELPNGRAVFLFGKLSRLLVEHAVRDGAPPLDAVTSYAQLFMAGLGVYAHVMGVEVPEPPPSKPSSTTH